MLQRQLSGSPAGEVLSVMQRRGNVTIKDLEEALNVTANAVRQQLTALLSEGLISQQAENIGRGRPKHVYGLTVKGRSLLSNHSDEFTNSLLREILVSDGPEKVQDLMGRMSRRLAAQYERALADLPSDERATKLTELLNAKGIMAEITFEEDSIVFHEYTCPYYELAREHRAVCDMEEEMIAHAMNRPVELVSCSLDGHHGCQFRIEA